MGCARRKGQENSEERVLEQNGLPEFSTLLFIEYTSARTDYIGVAVETHCIGLSNQDASESPSVRSMVVVDQEIGYENHGLD